MSDHPFSRLARKVAREFLPPHIKIATSFDNDWLREETADHVEIRAIDDTGGEPRFAVAYLDGRMLRSPMLEDAVRHEMRHMAKLMGNADKETR